MDEPLLVAGSNTTAGTGLILFPKPDSLPAVWAGPVPAAGPDTGAGPDPGLDPADAAALLTAARPCSLLPEHGLGWFGRPGLSGHRLGDGDRDRDGDYPPAGRDWSPLFRPTSIESASHRAVITAEDRTAGLRLVTEAEAVPGGAIRVRHTLTNTGSLPYVVDSLEVVFPLPAWVGEVLDFTAQQHPEVEWESCAAGSGRIDLAILERCQRVWPSDMTDALARQSIQRWTAVQAAPWPDSLRPDDPARHRR
jgi:alpha-galactosidase